MKDTICRECGQPIMFKRLPNGKLCPTALDGSDHFDTCSRLRAEIVKREGKLFERTIAGEHEIGYRWRGKDRLVQQDGLVIRGKDYVPPDHDCPAPPWEECQCEPIPAEQMAHLREILND
jgi:hypothetical protein